jgi:hypothetical protein
MARVQAIRRPYMVSSSTNFRSLLRGWRSAGDFLKPLRQLQYRDAGTDITKGVTILNLFQELTLAFEGDLFHPTTLWRSAS